MDLAVASTDNAPVRLADYRPTPYRVTGIHLDFDLGTSGTTVTAVIGFERREGTEPGTPLVLDGDELTLVSLAMNGA
ncbi:MAG: hypothetical protein OEL76_15820, partial [Siculibacillus sp.]|nr:hypothetical protein [Siculibacillus sp.]